MATILDDDLRVTAVEILGPDVRLSFVTHTYQTYRVERTDNLTASNRWATVPGAAAVLGTGAVVQI